MQGSVRFGFTLCAVALMASTAGAVDVTNLDKVDHKVVYETAGSKQVYAVGAGDTVHIAGQTNGFLSLITSENPKPSRGTLHSDGLLSGIIGSERTEDIPADQLDVFTIWPGGMLALQQHRIGSRFND